MQRIADCIQAMGANGLRADYPLARHLAGAKIAAYTDGSIEMMNERIGVGLGRVFEGRCSGIKVILSTVEMHTGGEPTRIIVDGWPAFAGRTLLDKRREAKERFDHLRRGLMLEPRGHDGMYGALLVEPDHPEADLAVLFMHNEGYSTMCGHATIALGALGSRERPRGAADAGDDRAPAMPVRPGRCPRRRPTAWCASKACRPSPMPWTELRRPRPGAGLDRYRLRRRFLRHPAGGLDRARSRDVADARRSSTPVRRSRGRRPGPWPSTIPTNRISPFSTARS